MKHKLKRQEILATLCVAGIFILSKAVLSYANVGSKQDLYKEPTPPVVVTVKKVSDPQLKTLSSNKRDHFTLPISVANKTTTQAPSMVSKSKNYRKSPSFSYRSAPYSSDFVKPLPLSEGFSAPPTAKQQTLSSAFPIKPHTYDAQKDIAPAQTSDNLMEIKTASAYNSLKTNSKNSLSKSQPTFQSDMIRNLQSNSTIQTSSSQTLVRETSSKDSLENQDNSDESQKASYEKASSNAFDLSIQPGLCLEDIYHEASLALDRVRGAPDFDANNIEKSSNQIQSLGFNGSLTVNFLPKHLLLDREGLDFYLYIPVPKTMGKKRRANIYGRSNGQLLHLGHIVMGSYGSGAAGFDLGLFDIASIDQIVITDAETVGQDIIQYCQNESIPLAGFGIDSIELTNYFKIVEPMI